PRRPVGPAVLSGRRAARRRVSAARAARWPGRSGQGRGQLVDEPLPTLLGRDVAEQDVLPGALADVLERAAALRRGLGGGAELGLDGVEGVNGPRVGIVGVGAEVIPRRMYSM